jgi:hypothetical protein
MLEASTEQVNGKKSKGVRKYKLDLVGIHEERW